MSRISILLLALLSACGLLDPERREIGVFDASEGIDAPVEVPRSAAAGEEFLVSIRTAWHNGCARKGEVEARVEASTVTLTPYDYIDERGVCTQATVRFTHTATVRFDEPGEGTVIIRGRSGYRGQVMEVKRTVTVE